MGRCLLRCEGVGHWGFGVFQPYIELQKNFFKAYINIVQWLHYTDYNAYLTSFPSKSCLDVFW